MAEACFGSPVLPSSRAQASRVWSYRPNIAPRRRASVASGVPIAAMALTASSATRGLNSTSSAVSCGRASGVGTLCRARHALSLRVSSRSASHRVSRAASPGWTSPVRAMRQA
jgi:hypothetical protein